MSALSEVAAASTPRPIDTAIVPELAVRPLEGYGTEFELEALLNTIESASPGLQSGRLAADVDELLGRSAGISSRASESPLRPPSEEKRNSKPRFEWFRDISASAAQIDDDQVVFAAKAVEVGLLAREVLETSSDHLARRARLDLEELARRGDKAFTTLILANLRLVFHWSKGIARTHGEHWAQDAFQAGCLGLIRGLKGYDHEKGFKLSTYVSWHIRQSIQRWRANEMSLIRLPVHIWDVLNSDSAKLDPKVQILVDQTQNVERWKDLDEHSNRLVTDGGVGELLNALDRSRLVDRMLSALTEREEEVLRLRFGLRGEGSEPMTLDQIGDVFGVTRERIRQIESKSIKRLRELAGA
jgi:RNA polymerase primary sigma factor